MLGRVMPFLLLGAILLPTLTHSYAQDADDTTDYTSHTLLIQLAAVPKLSPVFNRSESLEFHHPNHMRMDSHIAAAPLDFLIGTSALQLHFERSTLVTTLWERGRTTAWPRHKQFYTVVKRLVREWDDFVLLVYEDIPSLLFWTISFCASLLILWLVTNYFCSSMTLPACVQKDEPYVELSGFMRYSWNMLLAILCALTFAMALATVHLENADIRRQPQEMDVAIGGTVTRDPIAEPGKSAFESGFGVALSGAVACVTTCVWQRRGTVAVDAAVLGHFGVRGATLSIGIAVCVELIVMEIIMQCRLNAAPGLTFANFLMMCAVGVAEESAKLFSVVFCTWTSTLAFKKSFTGPSQSSYMRQLLDSPQAVMLAGLCVGFGFMTMENVEYVIAVASAPPTHYASSKEDRGASRLLIMTILTIMVRVALNLHPWLTAISAGRMAKLVFQEGRENISPTLLELCWAVAPSAVAHATFDFLVGGPPIIAIFMPLLFFTCSRFMFSHLWDAAPLWPAVAKLNLYFTRRQA